MSSPPIGPTPAALTRRAASSLAVLLVALGLSITNAPRAQADGIGISVSMMSQPNIGVPFTLEFGAHGGTPPYRWSVVEGALPPGLALLDTGEVAGTPLPSDAASTFTVRVVDASGLIAESAIALQAGRWSPPDQSAGPTTSVTEACEAALARAFRLPVMRLCERYRDPTASDLTRAIIGSMLEHVSFLPATLWMP